MTEIDPASGAAGAPLPQHYKELVETITANAPEMGGKNRGADAELRVRLVADQIAASERVASAANAHAQGVKRATWVLAIATIVLAIATVALVWVTVQHAG